MPAASASLVPLYTAADARDADRFTIEHVGVPGIVLMEHAGRAVADAAQRLRNADVGRSTRPIVCVCGPGNNGGDGWAAARHLAGRGIPAIVLTTRSPEDLRGDALLAAQLFLGAAEAAGWDAPDGGPPWRLVDGGHECGLHIASLSPAVVVDALFGTGLTRALEGAAAHVVEAMNLCGVPILAVDVPSGLPADGQAPFGACVAAIETITFGGRKIAHASEPGFMFCGVVADTDIGIVRPGQVPRDASVFLVEDLRALSLPDPGPTAHKGRYGHVLVLQGGARTRGASRLAARGALRAGAGLVSVLVSALAHATDDGDADDEVMRRALGDDADAALAGAGALVLGPGLGREEADVDRARRVLSAALRRELPVVADAEGIDLLFEELDALDGADRAPSFVATPHPGEAARILATTAQAVQADRIAAARALQRLIAGRRGVVILKGACPIVCSAQGPLFVVRGGAAPLAVAGSGDVLAGVVGGLLARGASIEDAALLATYAHQAAGKRLHAQAPRGWLAREIADAVKDVLAEAAR